MHPRKKIASIEELSKARSRIFNGSRVVLTSGCFDVLHGGHVEYLFLSKQYGDFLIVGINSDNFVKRLKGDGRPIRKEADRAFLVASMGMVDLVVIFDCDYTLIRSAKPNFYIASDNSKIRVYDDFERMEILGELGASIIELPYSNIDSTTAIINRGLELV
ncbi:MAG: RfaE bifunctional protein [uncultured bacterium]|nr:MAG: RfaE bifunctional protein [uncultured bacterium]